MLGRDQYENTEGGGERDKQTVRYSYKQRNIRREGREGVICRQTEIQAGNRQTNKQTDRKTNKQSDRRTNKQTDRQTNTVRQIDKQRNTDRQRNTGRQTDRQTY